MVSSLIKSLPLIVVIMTAAVDGLQDWGVNYSPSSVCALKGSTVKISCTLKYPPGHVIRTAYWTKHVVAYGESPDLCSDPEKRGGIQCRSEDKDTRSITLTNVREADKHVYYCRFTTNTDGRRWTGIPGVQLDVTDLQVETEQNVKVGDSVTLTCKSSCSLTEQTFIWLRDTQRVTKGFVKENQLHLQSANKSDSGNYRCAVRGNDLVVSPAVYVKVGPDYGLQDWGVYYSPSSVCALKGSTVKISCIAINTRYYDIKRVKWTKTAVYFREPPDLCSDPEKRGGIQCWNNYKDTSSITLTNVTEADEHFYFCKFNHWTVIPAPRLDVTDLQVETQQKVKEGDSVILTCKSSCSLTEQTFIWFRNTKGIVKENQLHLWSVNRSDAGNYHCAVKGNDHVISPPVYLKVESVDGLLDFGVNYSPSYVCTLKGSAVKISCTVEDTHFYDIKTVTWTKTAVTVREPPDLCSDPEKRGGIQCLSEEQTSSITLTNITEADKHVYYCRFTDNQNKRWTVITGAWLDVTDLQVETQQRVIEGDSVTLTCKSNCSLTEQTFIWFRNTQRLTDRKENQIHLESVSHSDAGNYQCAVRGNEHLISPAVYLNVEYPPKSVSVSVSPSEIVSGDSVTLNCSSDSNPPALNFRWLKGRGMVGYERIFIISNISSDHSEEYKCRSINEHGAKNSDAVKLNLMYKPKSVSVSVSPSGEIVSGDSVTLNCSSDSNPPAEISWFKGGTFLGSGDTYSISNITSESSGNYCCSAENKHGSQSSPAVTVNVMYPPKSVSVFVSPSEIVSGDSVTLNCSSDSNPPALNFSWFKEDETSAVGSGQSFSISSFNSSFSGRFYCEAQNKYGRQRSASVSVSVEGVQRDALYLVSGIVAGCGGLIFIIVFLTKKKRREGVFEDVNQKQTADAGCDTYRSLDPASRTPADVYSTITSRAPDDTYTALELQSRSSEYETLAVTSADPH